MNLTWWPTTAFVSILFFITYSIGYYFGSRNRSAPCAAYESKPDEPKRHHTPGNDPYSAYFNIPQTHVKNTCCDELDRREAERKEQATIQAEQARKENHDRGLKEWEALPVCSPEPKCRRCGSSAIETTTRSNMEIRGGGLWSQDESYGGNMTLRRKCMVCKTVWDEKPLDAAKEKV